MNFTVPQEIIFRLEQKYKDRTMDSGQIKGLIHDFFILILQRCIEFQSVNIVNFGKFMLYKVFSGKTGKETIRFSFYRSTALSNSMNKDEYILSKVPLLMKSEFGTINAEKCKNKQHIKLANFHARNSAKKRGSELNNEAQQNFENGIIIDNDKLKAMQLPDQINP